MAEDLLTRIQRELEERMEQLWGAMEERDRLQADLIALDAAPAAGVYPEPDAALDAELELPAALGAVPRRLFEPEPPFELEPPFEPVPPFEPERPTALDADPARPIYPEPAAEPEPDATVICFPARRELARAHAVSNKIARPLAAPARPAREHVVSAKVARLMSAPRRPALERSGIARVGERGGVPRRAAVDELDTQAELY
jgi:hypothetical protein